MGMTMGMVRRVAPLVVLAFGVGALAAFTRWLYVSGVERQVCRVEAFKRGPGTDYMLLGGACIIRLPDGAVYETEVGR